MKLSDFDYNLPSELIAQQPIKPRDHSRLLVLDKNTGNIEHQRFDDIINYFKKGDVLVMNNSKVIPARLVGQKKETGGKVEVFLHKKVKGSLWDCLLGGRIKEGSEIEFNKKFFCQIIKNNKDGTWLVRFNLTDLDFIKSVEQIGHVPLPPYIKRPKNESNKQDFKNYQTVYASENKKGSVAAPTAGFHFTFNLLKNLEKKGVEIEYLTLHVGLGTFTPVKTENIKKHKMHAEWAEIPQKTVNNILKAKKQGRRIISVGTTSTRALEAMLGNEEKIFFNVKNKIFNGCQGWIDIFIYPGYKFKVVDAIVTNFHLPKSTLLMLVSAFSDQGIIKKAYQEAIDKKYRFYSYGDAMFIK